ncbi:MAG: DUF4173 domain-containing protein [Lachnospiraceae bacterium]|nr:DUF4173 domain-containing protein [Lachnospiraceae bacterium]
MDNNGNMQGQPGPYAQGYMQGQPQLYVQNGQPYAYGNVQPYMTGQMPPQPYIPPAPKPESEQTKNLKRNYGVLGLGSLLYACFYAFCMYRNGSGITYPFFLIGSLWFYCFCMKKLEVSLKKDSIFYMGSILLLGISTFLTADNRIIAMNKTGVLVLIISFLLHQFYQDNNWTFGRYTGYVITAIFGSLGEIHRPFVDMSTYRKGRGKKGRGMFLYLVIGASFAVPLLFIIWLLLMSADRIFYEMTESFFKTLNIGNIFGILFTVIFMFFMTYCIMAYLSKHTFSEEYKERPRTEAVIAITVTLPLTLLYLVFSGVQIFALFLRQIDLSAYTYAEYAREGFFQLLAVCIINLVLVLVGQAYFKKNMLLKLTLTIMSLCTYVMIASSALRMILYIKHYYLTFLRIFVLWSLIVLFILLTGVIIHIYLQNFPLFKYSMVVVTFCYLVLSFGHPDYWIAKCNVANMGSSVSSFFDTDAYRDYSYMTMLSADAAPALAGVLREEGFSMEDEAMLMLMEYMQEESGSRNAGDGRIHSFPSYERYGGWRDDPASWGYYYLEKIYRQYHQMGIRSFNLSKYIAFWVLN